MASNEQRRTQIVDESTPVGTRDGDLPAAFGLVGRHVEQVARNARLSRLGNVQHAGPHVGEIPLNADRPTDTSL